MNILPSRISNQLLGDHSYKNPVEVVKHMLCLQSQDFKQAKRAIASRCGCGIQEIEDAYNTGQIVGTRTQRGTIHTVSAEDAGWMTKLCASKTLGGFKKRREYLGIADTQIDDILWTLPIILADGPMSRTTIAKELQSRGFDMTANKPYHIMCYAGTLGITVQGPIVNGEHCFVTASQWIKNPKILTEDESLAEICFRYFSSHGRATIADLQWRSGLGVGQIKRGILLCGDLLICKNGYYSYVSQTPSAPPYPPYQGEKSRLSRLDLKSNVPSLIREVPVGRRVGDSLVHFLAGFDEFLLGYKDRTATLDLYHHTLVDKARNGVFKPTVMIEGRTVATRSAKMKKDVCEITVTPFVKLDVSKEELERELEKYERFIEKKSIVLL